MFVYYLVGTVATFFQATNNWLFWPGVVVLVAAFNREQIDEVYWLAFVVGLVTDVLVGNSLGLSAIFLLLLAWVIKYYKTKFKVSWQGLVLVLIISQLIARLV